MYSRHLRRIATVFALCDAVLVAAAFVAAYYTRLILPFEHEFFIVGSLRTLLLGATVLLWVAIGRWLGIYEKIDSAGPLTTLRETVRQCALGTIGIVLLDFALKIDLSRVFLSFLGFYTWLLLSLLRLNSHRLVRFGRRDPLLMLLIAGTGERALRLARAVERASSYGVGLSGFLSDEPGSPGAIELARRYPVYPLSNLKPLLREHVIDEVLFAVDGPKLAALEDVFLLCDEEGVRTRIAVDFFPHVNSGVDFDRLAGIPLLTFSAAPHDDFRLFVKRVTDFAIALAGLVILAPVMLLIALLIRLTSKGPAIFRQVRCGLNGRRFVFYKFRSMCHDAEERKAGLAHLNQKTTAFKIPDDPRLTSVGKLLRRFSIDEWPQLWNVLRGDMSLVGPRPAVPDEVELYAGWQRRRLRMRPGLTCLWALNGRDSLDFDTWMKLDMQYIDNWSLALDWSILLRTIPRVLSGKGAH